ncbi:MAG: hypothetical protein HY072_10100 [Deltaproteobacteria bacterium]|nr:hypothetical protein [Deltaproteobacteria bacterium]
MMTLQSSLNHSVARLADAFDLMNLYQKSAAALDSDPLFLDIRKLQEALKNTGELWFLGHRGSELRCAMDIFIDYEQRIARLGHIVISPDEENIDETLKEIFKFSLDYLEHSLRTVDLLYTTTSTLTLKQQITLLDLNFKTLGIFPNFKGIDDTKLNGLTAYFFKNVLTLKRRDDFSLHPILMPFYEIIKSECALTPLPEAMLSNNSSIKETISLPALELIQAPLFIGKRFQLLKQNQALGMNFYPFQTPDAVITDDVQNIEIFIKFQTSIRFAMIVGEHLRIRVDPTLLYTQVLKMLREKNISYVEIINDAADTVGNDCFYKAGFTPCGYFPALKLQGNQRRDYVVFGRCSEYQMRPSLDLPSTYLAFFKQYYRLERRNFFPKTFE